ncbi:relaxase domain-containing protein [Streptomyces scopuliridis]|uniref:relaxase domain-containing protein n=1 Tax=Streptomyces scopuliridis TaxID=452529 RepID=UPI00367AFFFD
MKVTGVGLVFRPQPTLILLWALGDEETRRVIEAAHERAIAAVLAWIEDNVAVIRFGTQGIYRVRPAHGLVAARFRHYEARSGMPLLHDHPSDRQRQAHGRHLGFGAHRSRVGEHGGRVGALQRNRDG